MGREQRSRRQTLKLCYECGSRKASIPTVQHVDGSVDYVCKDCWTNLDYSHFLKERE